jgi:hypothetical protein
MSHMHTLYISYLYNAELQLVYDCPHTKSMESFKDWPLSYWSPFDGLW